MIEVKRAMTGTTLNPQHTLDPKKPFAMIDQFLSKDLDYTAQDEVDDEEGKDGPELDEDGIDTGPLELDTGALEMEGEDIHDLPPLPTTSDLEADAILTLPTMATEEEPPARRSSLRRRRSEDQ